jgi:hypothetical protein
VRPVVVGKTKLTPVGGSTKSTETKSVSLTPKLAMTKSPGSWPAAFFEKVVGDGAVTVGVAARAEALGRDSIVRTLEARTKRTVKALLAIR